MGAALPIWYSPYGMPSTVRLKHHSDSVPIHLIAHGCLRQAIGDVAADFLRMPLSPALINQPRTNEVPRVLVVDDDRQLLRELCDTLRAEDISCVAAHSVQEALRLFRRTPEIRVVITDIRMPSQDGFTLLTELARLTSKLQPGPRTIILSGHLDHAAAVAALRRSVYSAIKKPVRRHVILQTVRRALALSDHEHQRWCAARQLDSLLRKAMSQVDGLEQVITNTGQLISKTVTCETPRGGPGKTTPAQTSDAHTVSRLQRLSALKSQHFPHALFSDPVWALLLHLTQAHFEGKNSHVSRIASETGIPLSTALRGLNALANHGLIEKTRDAKDHRRNSIGLTDKAINLMQGYLRTCRI